MNKNSNYGGDGHVAFCWVVAEKTHALRREVLRDGNTSADIVSEADSDERALHIGAFARGSLVGVATSHPTPPPSPIPYSAQESVKIQGVAVTSAWRGQGIGSTMVHKLQTAWEAQNVPRFWASVRTEAMEFYRRLGFNSIGFPYMKKGRAHILMFTDSHHRQAPSSLRQ